MLGNVINVVLALGCENLFRGRVGQMRMGKFVDRERFRRDHRWAPGRMSDYLDGYLAPSGRRRMDRNLRECEECDRLLAGLRRTLDALHRLSTPRDGGEPLQIVASVRARLRAPE